MNINGTLKVGNGDGVSIRGLLNTGPPLLFLQESWLTPSLLA